MIHDLLDAAGGQEAQDGQHERRADEAEHDGGEPRDRLRQPAHQKNGQQRRRYRQ